MKDTNIVYLHCVLSPVFCLLRSDIRPMAKEITPNGQIEDNVKGLIKGLSVLVVGVVSLAAPHVPVDVLGVVVVPVDEPLDLMGSPLHGKVVEASAKVLWIALLPRAVVDVVGRRSAVVNRSHDLMWLITAQLHDVNLPRGSPGAVLAALGHHPEGRPEVVPTGTADARLKTTISPGVFGVDASTGEVLALVVLHTGVNHQVAVLYAHILMAVGSVELQLIVA